MGDDTRDFIASEDEVEDGDDYSIASRESRNMGQEDSLNLGAQGGTVPSSHRRHRRLESVYVVVGCGRIEIRGFCR
jgi:hypothetical protein